MSNISLFKVIQSDKSPLSQEQYDIIRKTERIFRIVTLSTFTLYTLNHLRNMAKMIRDSNTLPGKGLHQILTDMTEDKKELQLCETLSHRIGVFYDELPDVLSKWEYHGVKNADDHSEVWAEMIDVAYKIYEPAIKPLQKTLKDVFRKTMKPYDGVAFYRCLVCMYLSMVLDNLIASYVRVMDPEEMKPFKRLDLVPLVRSLMLHSSLKDSDGKYIAIVLGEEEASSIKTIKSKKYFNGRKTESWSFYNCSSLMDTEELSRVGYEFEKILFSFSTLTKINESVGAVKYDYERIFRMKYDSPCMTTYAQYSLVIALKKGQWKKARMILDKFVEEIPLYRGRKTGPVFGFYIGEDSFSFKGAWNSAGEASRECGWFFKDIVINVRENDKKQLIDNKDYKKIHNHIWVSLKRFTMVLDGLAES